MAEASVKRVSVFDETPAETAFRHADDARHIARDNYASSIGMAQTAKLKPAQRKTWAVLAKRERSLWDAAERRYQVAAKALGVEYHRLPTRAVNPRTGRPYDPESDVAVEASRHKFRGLGAAASSCDALPALLDRAEVALEADDARGARKALTDYVDTRVKHRCRGSVPSRFFDLESRAGYSTVYGSRGEVLSGLRGPCEDARQEAARTLRAAKTPAQRRAAQKFMRRVKSECGFKGLRGRRLKRKKR